MEITEFGVEKNCLGLQTKKIQNAIDKCSDLKNTLIFPEGKYNTGTLFIKSNSQIVLKKGAILCGSTQLKDYPDNEASFVDAVNQKRGKALLIAYECENIRISGEGEICGSGEAFNSELRPFLIRFVKSKGIILDSIMLTKAAAWCLHIDDSSDIDIRNVCINSVVNKNNDGIDIDGSDNVNIENCHIVSGDDAICLKATSDRDCKNITVCNCKISSGWAGFKIGTESVGDFYNISVHNCIFYDIMGCGIKIVPTDGAIVDNVVIKNIKMKNCTGPIFIANGTRLRKYANIGRKTYSKIKNIVIEDINADVVEAPERGLYLNEVWGNAIGGIIISGTPENPIENLVLKNLKMILPGGVSYKPVKAVPYVGEKYPEFHIMDVVPAKGIYMRNINNTLLEKICLSFKKDDIREKYYFQDVRRISFCD